MDLQWILKILKNGCRDKMQKILGKPKKEIYDEEKNQYISMKRGIKSSVKKLELDICSNI